MSPSAWRDFQEFFLTARYMVNVFYALDDPERCLAEVFRVLQPGGCLALIHLAFGEPMSRHCLPAIRANLAANDLLGPLRAAVEDAEDRHGQIGRQAFRRDTRDGVVGLSREGGLHHCLSTSIPLTRTPS